MPIYDSNNNIICTGVQSALSSPDVIEIKNRTLDGKYHIQTIGEGGTLLKVSAYLTPTEKAIFDAIKRRSALIRVTFDGQYYTGLIDGELEYNRLGAMNMTMFSVSFTLLVRTEGVDI